MPTRLRARFTYANVMSTIAVVLAVGGATAFAATHLPKNSVTSKTIKNGQVKTPDLHKAAVTTAKIRGNAVTTGRIADNAVSEDKIAPDSISGLRDIQNGTVQGSDIIENTLDFGCTPTPNIISSVGATGPFQVGNTGFCGFVVNSAAGTWANAAATCPGIVPDSTLPSAAQLEELATTAGTQSPPTGTSGIWLDAPAAAAQAWTASVGNNAHVSGFGPANLTTPSAGPTVCVYQPASKQG